MLLLLCERFTQFNAVSVQPKSLKASAVRSPKPRVLVAGNVIFVIHAYCNNILYSLTFRIMIKNSKLENINYDDSGDIINLF